MMRCEGGRVIGGWRPTVAREVADTGPQRGDERPDRRQAALEAGCLRRSLLIGQLHPEIVGETRSLARRTLER